MAARDRLRRYGSVRVLRDGRVRLSPLTDPMLVYLSLLASSRTLDVYRLGRVVLLMSLDRHRIVSACFAYDLSPEELRAAVSDIRRMGNGIERWIVPALESTGRVRTFREDNPAAYAIIPELLESCRDLSVADALARKPQVKARKLTQPGKRTRRK